MGTLAIVKTAVKGTGIIKLRQQTGSSLFIGRLGELVLGLRASNVEGEQSHQRITQYPQLAAHAEEGGSMDGNNVQQKLRGSHYPSAKEEKEP